MTPAEFATILILVLVLIIASFIAGLKLAGYYHRQATSEREYALKKQYARLIVGADADDGVAPYVPREPVQLPPEFGEHLKRNGRATVSLNPNPKNPASQT